MAPRDGFETPHGKAMLLNIQGGGSYSNIVEENGSPGRIRTAGQAINSRLLYR